MMLFIPLENMRKAQKDDIQSCFFFSIDDILYMDSDYQWPWLSDYPSNIGLNSILAPIHNFLTLFLDCFLGFA